MWSLESKSAQQFTMSVDGASCVRLLPSDARVVARP